MTAKQKDYPRARTGLKKTFLSRLVGVIFVLVIAGVGTYLLASSHAAQISNTTSVAPNFYGINWHPMWENPGGQAAEMDLMQKAGIKSVRIDAEWASLEPSPGNYQATYMIRLDYAINGLIARGIDPLVVVTSTPQWASGAPSTDPDPAHEPPLRTQTDLNNTPAGACNSAQTVCTSYNNVQAYDNFLSYLIKHWSGKVHEYEIWNEPVGEWAWRRTETTWNVAASDVATDYTTLLKSAYATAKAIDPNLVILGGSLAGTDGSNQLFLKAMYANGAKGSFDILSQHYYCDPPGHNWCNSNRNVDDPVTLGATYTSNIVPIMQANGDGSKPVWATETGYNTYTVGGGVSEAQAATYLTQTYNEAKTLPNVSRLYYYDMDGSDTTASAENYYGIIEANMYNANSLPANTRLKPAYTALQLLTASPVTTPTPPTPPTPTPAPTPTTGGTTTPPINSTINSKTSTTTAKNSKITYIVDGKKLTAAQFNATDLADGKHKVEEVITDPDGHTTTKQETLTVNKHQPFWRNAMLRYGDKRIAGGLLVSLGIIVVVAWLVIFRRRQPVPINPVSVTEPVIIRPTNHE